ncbi:subclass B2 metallo-beta-lactamase [Pigmentibacter ruber]|uniref:subclass B2 metallo-beta-lactamase n=1 Tax=Pigmentibacter ruber TaxID=2683196 RepID=UPI00131BF6CE|nr:subclass B2 metallo-beta-lactamase [Pigmentibacter ruber]BFD33309.1 CphA family subclass B2 metallo-beta-lactamase [Pigmentibacter ruber]
MNILKLFSISIISCFSISTFAAELSIKKLKDAVYVVEDDYFYKENSMFYIGEEHITVVGATWSNDTALLLANEIKKISNKPIKEVINTNYHPDRAGGNLYWKSIGATIISTQLTYDLMQQDWKNVIDFTKKSISDYPRLPFILPTKIMPSDFQLQNGKIKSIYLGPSHTKDGIFIYFPKEEILYGNCILKEKLGNLSYADLDEYPKTLQKLKNLNLKISYIVAGHDSPIHEGSGLIDHYLSLLEKRKK